MIKQRAMMFVATAATCLAVSEAAVAVPPRIVSCEDGTVNVSTNRRMADDFKCANVTRNTDVTLNAGGYTWKGTVKWWSSDSSRIEFTPLNNVAVLGHQCYGCSSASFNGGGCYGLLVAGTMTATNPGFPNETTVTTVEVEIIYDLASPWKYCGNGGRCLIAGCRGNRAPWCEYRPCRRFRSRCGGCRCCR